MSPPSLTQSAAGALRQITHLCLFPASTQINQRGTLMLAEEGNSGLKVYTEQFKLEEKHILCI